MAVSLYRPEDHREFAFDYGQDIGAGALCYLSWALWHSGYPDRATRTADRALFDARAFGHAHTLAYTLWHTAIEVVLARDVRRVERLASESAAISTEHGFPLWCAYADALLGWVAARRGQVAGFELRAATSLVRLCGDGGRREQARELLAPVYGSFREGFDAADLKDAKTLLTELG